MDYVLLCMYFMLAETLTVSVCVCLCVYFLRLQDAVSLVSLFHMVHPHSESAQEAASQQATGTNLLKVRTHDLDRKYLLTFTFILHPHSLFLVYIWSKMYQGHINCDRSKSGVSVALKRSSQGRCSSGFWCESFGFVCGVGTHQVLLSLTAPQPWSSGSDIDNDSHLMWKVRSRRHGCLSAITQDSSFSHAPLWSTYLAVF